ncbi:hypothetical protein ID866_8097 [Astraeus odoratus]|nr:hypothetical protein ID866_8097 [Astraeus odoratus]
MTKSIKAVCTAAVVAFLAGAVAPAHAISEAYRKQLEHSHRTQLQDANGYQAPVASAHHFTPVHANKFGVNFSRGADGIGHVDGKACATDEQNAQAASYSCGIYQIIVRANGRVDLMKDNQYVGRMKG